MLVDYDSILEINNFKRGTVYCDLYFGIFQLVISRFHCPWAYGVQSVYHLGVHDGGSYSLHDNKKPDTRGGQVLCYQL